MLNEWQSAKKQRQRQRECPVRSVNAEIIARSADAVLRVSFNDVKFHSRTDQVVVGLCRAAFAQSKVIAALARSDMLSAAVPNRRLVLEIALHLHWLQGSSIVDRRKTIDAIPATDRRNTNRLLDYLRDTGYAADFDPTEMDSLELEHEARGTIHQQATKLKAAVESNEVES